MQMAQGLGGDAYRLVSEIYSPPRVTAAARRLNLGLLPGFAFDLTCEDENGKASYFDDVEVPRLAVPVFARQVKGEAWQQAQVEPPRCRRYPRWAVDV